MGRVGIAERKIRIFVQRFGASAAPEEPWFLSYEGMPFVALDELVKQAIRDPGVRAIFTSSRVTYDDAALDDHQTDWKKLHAIDLSWKKGFGPVRAWPLENKA